MPEEGLGAVAAAAADFKGKFWCLIVNGSRIIQNPRRSDYARILDTGHLLLFTENFLLKISRDESYVWRLERSLRVALNSFDRM